jgi:quercetin dioxygenase-like cupin family protein
MNTASFLKELEFSDKGVVIKALIISDFGREIRITFKKDQIMKEHKTQYPITVMTLQGSIEFTIGNEKTILNQGDIIAVDGNVMHELKALEESVVKLSLHKNDTVERVKNVVTE